MKNEQMKVNRAALISLCFFTFSLLTFTLISCDLFSPPADFDLLEKIDAEIAWSNADRLTVTVTIPPLWGSSLHNGTNRCFDNIQTTQTPRRGYPFTIEFTPELAYSFDHWRAYLTSSLPPNWTSDVSLLETAPRIDGSLVSVPAELPARGGSGSFTINTPLPVTLVPWCRTEPYIVRTSPRHSPDTLYPRGTDIIIYFNAPLTLTPDVDLPLLFTSGAIVISADGVPISANNDYYNYPVYTASVDRAEYKVIISATDVPGDSLIEVTVGPDIFNTSIPPAPMAEAEVFSFATSPAMGSGNILTWGAEYTGSSIIVNWTNDPEVLVEARYRVDQTGDNELINKTIQNVTMPNFSNIRQGGEITGIREYEIFLDLYIEGIKSNAGSKSFKIWNITGMTVSETPTTTNTATASDQATLIAAINDVSKTNIVLTESITLSGWMPPDLNSRKFYGNGHTVTIINMSAAADMGLFGTVNGDTVRDLTVQYNTATVSPTGEARFGGIAGTVQGNAQLINVLVKGAVSVNGSGPMTIGGIAGRTVTTLTPIVPVSIHNAYSGLNLNVDNDSAVSTTTTGNSHYIGGIIGNAVNASNFGTSVSEISVEGNITVGGNGEINSIAPDSNNDNGLIVGGLVGLVSRTLLTDCDYRQGTIKVSSGNGNAYLGGSFGRTLTGTSLTRCSVSGSLEIIKTGNCGTELNGYSFFYLGGFVGDFSQGTANNCFSENTVTVEMKSSSTSDIIIGGFAGRINANISHCYSLSDINVTGNASIFAGGFTAKTNSSSSIAMNNCYAAGDVNVISLSTSSEGDISILAAGFVASLYMNLRDSYALGNVFINSSGRGGISAGGLVGYYFPDAPSDEINRCFSTGTVTAHRDYPSGTTYAGALVGRELSSTITNSAALGASVTVTGGYTRNAGRVFGDGTSTGHTNNRAFSGMRIFNDPDYDPPRPTEILYSALSPSPDHDNNHGLDAGDGTFRNSSNWTAWGFTATNGWDVTTAPNRRHPILTGLGGQ